MEELLVARLGIQSRHTHAVVAEPHQAVTVHIDAEDTHAVGLAQLFRLLAVGEGVDAAVGCRGVDVIAVGVQTGDMFVGKDGLLLKRQVSAVQSMDALVRSQPDVALIAFGHAGDGEAPGIHLLALQSATVQAHDEQTVAVDTDQHLSGAGYE